MKKHRKTATHWRQVSPLSAWLVLVLALVLGAPSVQMAATKTVRVSSDPVKDEPPITEEDLLHWSFKPLLKPKVPDVRESAFVRNEIDRFVLAKLSAQEQPRPMADPLTLIRRVTFDLTGLPPTPDEVERFLTACGWTPDIDPRALPTTPAVEKAYETLVDRLLLSPRHGEKWAQHWLDLARYAESDGYERDLDRKEAWKYRDWVIDAINDDLPYDDFVAFQIAGDELPDGDAVATSFLFAGPDMPDSNFQDERLHLLLNDVTSTFGSAFLGLTVGCAQCHDHPYDPVSQADFYRLRAFFDNLPKLKKDTQLGSTMQEASDKEPMSRICIRGDYQRPGPVVKASFLRVANRAGMSPATMPVKKSSGRRTALARWLTHPTNGLFLRASVNQLWQHHFGKPLAGTPGDLGRQGQAPSDPDLLDWLASELPLRKWSMKSMHKLIVMSGTYRSVAQPSSADDPENSRFAGFERHRLSGEELRDAMLFASGRFNPQAGGPGVHVPLPPEMQAPAEPMTKKKNTVPEDPASYDRRSIYVFAKRNVRQPLFDLFDKPDAMLSCSRRSETVTAPQALTLFNSDFSLSLAKSFAVDLLKTSPDLDSIIGAASWRCFSRPPTSREMELGRAFLNRHTALATTFEATVTDYCLALMNSSAFCYVD